MSDGKSLKELMDEVNSAIVAIEEHKDSVNVISNDVSNQEVSSLLEQCERIVLQNKVKPKLRIIHHLACSGGTLISKCIAALPNVYLISEAHPHSKLHMQTQKAQYRPTDIISLSRYANVPDSEKLAEQVFLSDIQILRNHVDDKGGVIVLRDHSHVDFCVSDEFVDKPSLMKLLSAQFEIIPIVTVRHPIDSYLSLLNNGWVHFEPKTFDEYCRRYLAFISHFKSTQIMKYETFVKRPVSEMKRLSSKLDLPFTDSFMETFPAFTVTGDSGRGGEQIAVRERRPVSEDLIDEINKSKYFAQLIKKLKYKSL